MNIQPVQEVIQMLTNAYYEKTKECGYADLALRDIEQAITTIEEYCCGRKSIHSISANPAVREQTLPADGEGDMWQEVIHDMENRRQLGIEKYGKPLQAHNGRDALVDAYQEALDLVVYLKQCIKERNAE